MYEDDLGLVAVRKSAIPADKDPPQESEDTADLNKRNSEAFHLTRGLTPSVLGNSFDVLKSENIVSWKIIGFCGAQFVLLAALLGAAGWRYEEITSVQTLPEPATEPVRVRPLYNEPEIISDAQLQRVLEKLKPRLRGGNPAINQVDHALRFWGVEAVFADPDCLSGQEMREILLDHRRFSQAWGPKTKPFLVPDVRGGVALRTREGNATASHVDHTLAGLAEVGTPLDYPVIAPEGEYQLRAVLESSLREFTLNQVEYEWSTLAFLHYLPHVKSWQSTEGQEITWDRLAGRLMRQRLAQGVCFGNHRLHALVMLLRVDETHGLLSAEMRSRVIVYLQDATARLIANQHEEGYWSADWPGVEADGPQPEYAPSPLGPQARHILATGHALEWWAFAPAEVLPPLKVRIRAAGWLVKTIDDLTPQQVQRYYTYLSHAGRALSLWRGHFPAEVFRPGLKLSK